MESCFKAIDPVEVTLREESVGILRRLILPSCCMFSGKLKQRFSDFVVNELDEHGVIKQITSIEIPADKIVVISYQQVETFIKADHLEKLKQLESGEILEVKINALNASKDQLRSIHHYIRQNFSNLRSSRDNETITVVSSLKNHQRKRKLENQSKNNVDYRQNDNNWPYGDCKYVHFVMYKENMTTLDALTKMAKQINVQVKRFSIAGNKDKQGKTSQRVSAFKVNPKSLIRVNQLNTSLLPRSQCLLVGSFNVEETNKEIRLGCLQGNNFIIVIREFGFLRQPHSTANEQNIEPYIEHLLSDISERGFLNYFGTQRFGFVANVATSHVTGIMIMKKQYETAINNILQPKSFLSENLNSALNVWHSSKNINEACSILNRQSKETIEGFILLMLKNDNPNFNYKNVIMKLPRNTRNLYIHSYQSYLWNKVVSYRIKNYGMDVLVGDIVYDEENLTHRISQEDINCNSYSILDVYLQLVSANLSLPAPLEEYIHSLLEQDGIKISHFADISKEFNVSDKNFRKLIEKPTRFYWRLVDYSNENELLIDDPPLISELKKTYYEELSSEMLSVSEKAIKKKALILDFNLPSSSYATVLMGEIVQDSSVFSSN